MLRLLWTATDAGPNKEGYRGWPDWPSNDGNMITIPIPPLTQERRQDMDKILKSKIEDGKVSVRNVRRDAVESLRKMEKDKTISQDENHRNQDQVQKATDVHTKTMDEISGAKEAEILQV